MRLNFERSLAAESSLPTDDAAGSGEVNESRFFPPAEFAAAPLFFGFFCCCEFAEGGRPPSSNGGGRVPAAPPSPGDFMDEIFGEREEGCNFGDALTEEDKSLGGKPSDRQLPFSARGCSWGDELAATNFGVCGAASAGAGIAIGVAYCPGVHSGALADRTE